MAGAQRAALERFGADAVSFQGARIRPRVVARRAVAGGTGAALAYLDTGRSWIGVGRPLAADCRRAGRGAALRRRGAREPPRAPCSSASRRSTASTVSGASRSACSRSSAGSLAGDARREPQAARAAATGARQGRVGADRRQPATSRQDTPLRHDIERLARRMARLTPDGADGFPGRGRAVPRPGAASLRRRRAKRPRRAGTVGGAGARRAAAGCSRTCCAAARRRTAPPSWCSTSRCGRSPETAAWATPGLTPLAGPVAWWLRAASAVDDAALRLRRAAALPRPPLAGALDPDLDGLGSRSRVAGAGRRAARASPHGRLVGFALRSLTRHPNGPPWIVALPLVPWTGLLAGLVVDDRARSSASRRRRSPAGSFSTS